MKIDRLIGILSVLLQKDRVTCAELAKRFEVSERTILRDMETLNMSGIPVAAERGRGGGVYIMDGYRIDRTLLSSDDMRAILSGLRSLDSVSMTGRYRQLMEKMSAGSVSASGADSRIMIDLSNWDRSAVADKIELIKNAVDKRQIIAFRYFSPGGESSRRIEPYHLVYRWSSWYVYGYCTGRGDYRLFKLSRMTELAATGERYTARDVPEYAGDKLTHTEGEVEATVRFSPSVKWRVVDCLGAGKMEYDADGCIVKTFTWSDKQSLFSFLLSFGSDAELLAPPAYRREFAGAVKDILARYKT